MSENCQIISTIQQKGGTGKTTLICTLAASMTKDGARVAIVDSDPLKGAGDYAARSEAKGILIDYTHELDESALVKKVRALSKRGYDALFIDTAGVDAKVSDYAVQLSDLVLIPVKAARQDLKGLVRSMNIVGGVSELSQREIPVFVIMSDIDRQTNITAEIRRIMEDKEYPLLDAQLLHRTGFKEFMTNGGFLTGAAKQVGDQVIAEMQIRGLLDFYRNQQAA